MFSKFCDVYSNIGFHKPLKIVGEKAIEYRKQGTFYGFEQFWKGACWSEHTRFLGFVAQRISLKSFSILVISKDKLCVGSNPNEA